MAALCLSAQAFSACSAPGSGNGSGRGGAGPGASGTPGSGGTIIVTRGGQGGGGPTDCAGVDATTEWKPAILQLVVDISGSMNCEPGSANVCGGGPKSKWSIVKAALQGAAERLPKETVFGANFYPPTGTQGCEQEVAIPLMALKELHSPERERVKAGIEAQKPLLGATPTHSAVRFGVQTLKQFKGAPGSPFVVLITDGEPSLDINCVSPSDPIGPIVEEARRAAGEGIRTFVVGSPGSEGARAGLSQIAEAGDTGTQNCSSAGPRYCHFDLTTEPDLGGALQKALEEISGKVLSCEIPIPPPPEGQRLDLSKVNVVMTKDGAPEVVARDPSSGQCNSGWQFSQGNTAVQLCPDACARARSAVNTAIAIRFGCQTVIR